MDKNIGTYELKQHGNVGKLKKIKETIYPYRRDAKAISAIQWRLFFDKDGFDKNDKTIKESHLELWKRYRQTCQYQVVGMLDSFIENRKNDFREIVYKSKLPEEEKLHLFYINKCEKWLDKSVKIKKKEIPKKTLFLAKKIFKHTLDRNRKPRFNHINMALDAKIVEISKATKGAFDYWINVSTVNKNDTVLIPLKTNIYFEKVEGKLLNFAQINMDDLGDLHFSLIKEKCKKEYKPETEKMSLDIGLRVLFASNEGDLLGRKFFQILNFYDHIITEIAKRRQKNNLKVRCKEYDHYVGALREYLKNEINRCLNRVVEIYKPRILVAEKLNFSRPHFSKRMNRLIKTFGLGLINKKLEAFEKMGIEVIRTNAAYSSRECSKCGYVAKNNRQERGVFVCKFCLTEMHADVNGARNNHARSSRVGKDVYKSKQIILHELTDSFRTTMEQSNYAQYRWASALMAKNPYFSPSAKTMMKPKTTRRDISSKASKSFASQKHPPILSETSSVVCFSA